METVFLLNRRYFGTIAVPNDPYHPDICLHIPHTSPGTLSRVRFNGVILATPPNTERMVYVAEISAEQYTGLKLPVYIEE